MSISASWRKRSRNGARGVSTSTGTIRRSGSSRSTATRSSGFLFQVTGGLVPQIAELGVRPPWRGRGIGTALLRHSFADIARRGGSEVTLWVDSENATGAVGVYERVGMRAIVVTDVFQADLG